MARKPADARNEIEAAKRLLEEVGIKKSVDPRTLVSASRELGKGLRETLDYMARLFRAGQGGGVR